MGLAKFTSRGGFSARSIFLFVLTALVTVFSAQVLLATPASAEEPTATWNGALLLYDGKQYSYAGEAKAGDSHQLPVDSKYYVSIEVTAQQPRTEKAHVIYFPTGTDPPTATTATYKAYDYASNVYSNPSAEKTVTVTPGGSSGSSCAIGGMGWLLCPMLQGIAWAVDAMFGWLKNLVTVQPPVLGDTNNPLYVSWNVMRSIANIAFIIVFLIVIYAQLTSTAVSNYGIKKIAPRLLIAALLVNLSYYICAIAIDISNIAGIAVYDIFMQINGNPTYNITWEETTDWIMSGGVFGALAIGAIGVAGSITTLLPLLVPVLLGVALTIVVVVLILAARQALIVILVALAPLAFIAFLLPNTEKLFKQWQGLFTTMLVFFPAFSLVFGGAQVAGNIIILNAPNVGSGMAPIMVILGMAVQIAPLVITPLILKLSGGVLGKIGAIVNDPKKGIMDRTRNWAKNESEMRKQRSLARGTNLNIFRAAARGVAHGTQSTKDKTELYKSEVANRYHRTRGYGKLHPQMHSAEVAKQTTDARLNTRLQSLINDPNSHHHREHVQLERQKMRLDQQQKTTAAIDMEYKAGRFDIRSVRNNHNARELAISMAEMKATATTIYAQVEREKSAQYVVQENISNDFDAGTMAAKALISVAAGVDYQNGAIRVQANTAAALGKLKKESLENSVQLVTARALKANMSPKEYAASIADDVRNGIPPAPGREDERMAQMVEAAYDTIAQDGDISRLIEARLDTSHVDQEMLTRVLTRNAGVLKEKGGFHLQAKPSLAGVTRQEMNISTASDMLGGVGAGDIAKIKGGLWDGFAATGQPGSLDTILGDIATYQANPATKAEGDKAEQSMKDLYVQVSLALNNPNASTQLGDHLKSTIKIHKQLENQFGTGPGANPKMAVDYTRFEL